MTYSGNKLYNSNNIVLLIAIVIFGAFAINEPQLKNRYIYLIMVAFTFLNTILNAYYFEITQDELIVKNYMIPFLTISYSLSEITEVKLLNNAYKATTKSRLKIIRGDKRSIGFNGSSLKLIDWQEMVNDLSAKKITGTISKSVVLDKIGIPESR
jgi:hypothetical protein